MELGKRLVQLRKINNVTQEELGKQIDVGKTTISNYETGYSSPDSETLTKLADFFGVSVDYLLGRTDIKDKDDGFQHVNDDEALEYLDELHKRPEMKVLFDVSRKASKEDIETTIAIIEALKKKGGKGGD